MSHVFEPLRIERLDDATAVALDRDGYVLLRGAIPAAWLAALTDAFEAGYGASDRWSPPRASDWRHALVDLDPAAQRVCRLPPLLAAVRHLLGQTFFLAQVEGREPVAGGGFQALHRDVVSGPSNQVVSALAFMDRFGPANGATRLVPGSHRHARAAGEADAVSVEGDAGDILVFDANLLHGGGLNISGAARRSLLINYFAAPLIEQHRATLSVRHVRMPLSEMFGA